jgi:ketosteroid isomerase-like protein
MKMATGYRYTACGAPMNLLLINKIFFLYLKQITMKILNRLLATNILLSTFTIALLTTQSCQQAPKDITKEIQKAADHFSETFKSGNADAMADLYTANGVLYPPDSPPIRGSENIRAFWQAVFDAGITEAKLKTNSADGYGNHAIEEGEVSIFVGDQMVGKENYLVVWHKVNNEWKLHQDMFNSSLPKPDNAGVIQSLYNAFAKGDVPGVLAGLDAEVVWNEAENFPYADGNPYIGHDAVVNGVFARIGAEWEYWNLLDMSLSEMGSDKVFATGRYNAKHKRTGKSINAQFVHVWTLKDGKAIQFQQYADTKQVAAAIK